MAESKGDSTQLSNPRENPVVYWGKAQVGRLRRPKQAQWDEETAETENLNLMWGAVYNAFRLTSLLAKVSPPLVDTASRKTADITVNVAAASLNHLVREDLLKNHPKEVAVQENPRFRSYTEILQKGIENFQAEHLETPVTWHRNPGYFKISEYFSAIDKNSPISIPLKKILLNLQDGRLARAQQTLTSYLPEHAAETINRSSQVIPNQISATYERKTLAIDSENIINTIASKYSEMGEKPLSIEHILPIFLEKTSGDLTVAMYALAGFLKRFRRSDRGQTIQNEWFKKYIADEYSTLAPYQDLTQNTYSYEGKLGQDKLSKKVFEWGGADPGLHYMDFSLSNQIGKPYHAANLAALLEYFPPDAIAAMTAVEYLRYGPEHGASKALADVMILKELRKIEKLFQKFEVKNSKTN